MDHSPLNQLAETAAQKMLTEGIDGISDKEFALVMAHWTNGRADAGRKEVIDALAKHTTGTGNGSKMDAVKRNAPVAGGGFGVGMLVAFVRELFGG